jgi:hypothetical protein
MPTDRTATEAFRDNPVGFLANAMLPPISPATRHNHSEHLGLNRVGQGEPVTGTWSARLGSATGTVVPL